MADTEYTREQAWAQLLRLAGEEYSDAAASVQHGADSLPEVPEWARLVVQLAALPSASLGEQREPELTVRAIAEHIDGWRSATFGWQDNPDPVIAERNKQAAIQGHAAECLRRIHAALAASKSAGGGGEREERLSDSQRREALSAALMRFAGHDKHGARVIAGNLLRDDSGPPGTSPDQQKGGA
jgi:hypothetical protein